MTLLKVLIIVLVLGLLSFPFLPLNLPFTLSHYNYPPEERPKNLLNLIVIFILSLVVIAHMPIVLNLAGWIIRLPQLARIVSILPHFVAYDLSLAKAIFANLLYVALCLAVLGIVQKVFNVISYIGGSPSDRKARRERKRREKEAAKKKRKEERERKRREKGKEEENKETEEIKEETKRESDKERKERKKNQQNAQRQLRNRETTVLPDYLLPDPEEEDLTSNITIYTQEERKNKSGIFDHLGKVSQSNSRGNDSSDKKRDSGRGYSLDQVLETLASFYYEKIDSNWMARPQCQKVAKQLKNFLIITGILYLVVFFLLLIPALFYVKIASEWFYSLMIHVAENCYLYPTVSLVFLTELFWFLNGEEAPVSLWESGEEEWIRQKGIVIDLDTVEEELMRAYGQHHEIKSFFSDDIEDPRMNKRSIDLIDSKLLRHISKLVNLQGLEVNRDYLKGIQELQNGQHVLFDAPLYSSVAPYLYAWLNGRISMGYRVVVVCQHEDEIPNIIENLQLGFSGILHTHEVLWEIADKNRLKPDRNVDILVVTPVDLCREEIYEKGVNFFSKVALALFPDADRVVVSNNYYCLMMAERLRQAASQSLQFLFLTLRHELNLKNSLRQYFSLDTEIQEIDSYYAYGSVRIYIWKTRNDGSIMLDNGAKNILLEVAISNLAANMNIPHINVVSEGAIFPNQVDSRWLGVYDSKYQPIGFAIVADDRFNLPAQIFSYTRFIGKKASILHVICKPYLLRDYFFDNAARYVYERPLMEQGIAEHADLVKNDMIMLLCRLIEGMYVPAFMQEIEKLTNEKPEIDETTGLPSFVELTRLVNLCLKNALAGTKHQVPQNCFSLSEQSGDQFELIPVIRIHEEAVLEALLEDTSLVRVELVSHGTIKRFTLDLFRKMLNQKYLTGQNLVYNHANYTIQSIDQEQGILYVDDASSVHGIPQDYIQIREYTVKEGMDSFAAICREMANSGNIKETNMLSGTCLHETGDESLVSNLTMVRAKGGVHVQSRTLGYYMLRSDANEIDLTGQALTERSLTQSAREKLARDVDHVMYLQLSGRFARSNELTMTLAVLLQEMMKTLFPNQYFCLSVCPILEKPESIFESEDLLCRQIARMYPQIIGWEKVQPNSIELLLVDDCEGGSGLLDLLFEYDAVYMKNIFGMLYDYLLWQKDHEAGTYIYFGSEKMPDIFYIDGLREVLRSYSSDYIRESDIYRKMQMRDSCFFCGKHLDGKNAYLWGDGHRVCQSCLDEYRPGEEEAKQILDHIRTWIVSNFEAIIPDDLKVIQVKEGYFEKDQISELDLDNREIAIADNIPLNSVHRELLQQTVFYWQLITLQMDGDPEIEGQIPYVLLQYLTSLLQYQQRKRLYHSLLTDETSVGEGYRSLSQSLSILRTEDSFSYLSKVKIKNRSSVLKKRISGKNSRKKQPEEVQYYYYDQLSEDEQGIYNCIYKGILNQKPEISLDKYNMHTSRGFEILDCVLYDHPDLFWIRRSGVNAYSNDDTLVSMTLMYVLSSQEVDSMKEEIDKVIPQYLEGITPETGDYDAALLLYERIIDKLDYDTIGLERKMDQDQSKLDPLRNIYSALVDHKAVCAGYAMAYQYLLQLIGIDSVYVCGTCFLERGNGRHAWNIVKLEGDYYHIDTTWGDFSRTDENSEPGISYAYFAVTDSDIRRSRSIEQQPKPPKCDAESCNYFVHNDLYFMAYDYDVIKQYTLELIKKKELLRLEMRFANNSILNLARKHLWKNGGFREILRAAGEDVSEGVFCSEDEKMCTLTFWLPGWDRRKAVQDPVEEDGL